MRMEVQFDGVGIRFKGSESSTGGLGVEGGKAHIGTGVVEVN